MHEVYSIMRARDFCGLPPLCALAALVAALCMDLGSVGREDEALCAERHDLAITYAFYRPQKQAAVAEVLRVASVEEADIFSSLSASESEVLRGDVAHGHIGWDRTPGGTAHSCVEPRRRLRSRTKDEVCVGRRTPTSTVVDAVCPPLRCLGPVIGSLLG